MKAKKVKSKFETYIDSIQKPAIFRKYPKHVATLFGSDQFELDASLNRVKLPEIGWVDVYNPVPNPKRVAWVALFKSQAGFEVAFGQRGVSPYSNEAAEFLPVVDGVILAMPWLDITKVKDKMIAT